MAKLSDLEKDLAPGEKVDIPDEVPEERGGFQRKPEPGDGYIMQLPETLDFSTYKSQGMTQLKVNFFKENALTVVGAADESFIGSAVNCNISTWRVKEGKGPKVSAVHYLLLALGEKPTKDWTLKDLGDALERHAGEQFGCSVEWSVQCRNDKVRYIVDADDRAVEDPEGTKGCGARIFQSSIHQEPVYDRDTGEPILDEAGKQIYRWPYRIACACGATLRPDVQVLRFKPVA